MTSLEGPDSPENMYYPGQSTGDSKSASLASSQSKLDRLACFAAISDTSVGTKRMELQRRQLATGRRLSQPVTIAELDKTETWVFQRVARYN